MGEVSVHWDVLQSPLEGWDQACLDNQREPLAC